MKLCTGGQMEGMYYKPRIDKEILAEHSAGLIALSGCLQGEVASRVVENALDGARESQPTFRDIFTKDRFLLQVPRPDPDPPHPPHPPPPRIRNALKPLPI